MSIKYGKLIINNRASELDRLFTYIIDDDLVDIAKVGMRVLVPFGRGNKIVTGLLVKIEGEPDVDYRLKKIIDLLDDKPLISDQLIKLGFWIRKEYLSTYLESFQPILPPGDFKKVNSFIEIIEENYRSNIDEEIKIINYLRDKGPVLLTSLKEDLKIININKYINNLENSMIIETTIDIHTSIQIKTEKWVRINDKIKDINQINDLLEKRYPRQRKIASYLLEKQDISMTALVKSLKTSMSTVKELENKNIINIYDKTLNRDPIKKDIAFYRKHKLNEKQRRVFDIVANSLWKKHRGNKFLLHGVTGSGKTEIYLQLVEECLKMGKSTIVLVPEISLTPQTIDRFVGRFGRDVAILHSRLSAGERFDEWRKIKEGKVSIVVGARSAVFAPFSNLGLIIIDEEHESSYKSSQNPKYNTIEVARKRADLEGACLVLASATPEIDSYYKGQNKDLILLELDERVNKNELPEVILTDMREELKSGNRTMLSRQLEGAILAALEDKKQTILFLNRRGFSTFVTCRECGYVVKCKECDISLTYYKGVNKLRCHYCGKTEDVPSLCPQCKSKYIRHFGIGTEKVEEYIREIFPAATIARMDSDTTSTKDSYEKILSRMKDGKIDILIGTQMIAKGLDFENVTLVGIIAADTSLNLPDYKSPERTFQLITQVAGRAGRGKYKGKVVLQTYNPDHYSIRFAQDQDYKSFYNSEIVLRREFLYPPYISLVSILIYGENKYKVGKIAKDIYNIIGEEVYKRYGENYFQYINGPNPAPLERIKNNFRWIIILKLEEKYMELFKELIKDTCIDNKHKLDMKDIKLSVDINPNSII